MHWLWKNNKSFKATEERVSRKKYVKVSNAAEMLSTVKSIGLQLGRFLVTLAKAKVWAEARTSLDSEEDRGGRMKPTHALCSFGKLHWPERLSQGLG